MAPSIRRIPRQYSYAPHEVGLDSVDRELLAEIVKEPRASVASLAKRVKMSRPAVAQRIRRLEDSHIITGWSVQLDPVALGLTLAAYVRIRPMARQLGTVAGLLQSIPWVVECHRVTGDDCYIARVHVPSIQDLERLIDRIQPYAQTTTSIVQSSPVPLRPPPLPSAAGSG